MIKRFVKNVEERGGEIRKNTHVQKLIVENGLVCGVEAVDKKGDKLIIHARKVIIATGGFAANKEMLAQYVFDSSALGMVEPIWLRGPVVDGRTGDGINMAFEVGAVGDNMGPMMLNGAFMPAEGEAICNGANKEVRALFRQGLLYAQEIDTLSM